jgi:hypothetical protein
MWFSADSGPYPLPDPRSDTAGTSRNAADRSGFPCACRGQPQRNHERCFDHLLTGTGHVALSGLIVSKSGGAYAHSEPRHRCTKMIANTPPRTGQPEWAEAGQSYSAREKYSRHGHHC